MNMMFGGTGVELVVDVTTGELAMSVESAIATGAFSAKTDAAISETSLAAAKYFMTILLVRDFRA
jgi:hypothetical protein